MSSNDIKQKRRKGGFSIAMVRNKMCELGLPNTDEGFRTACRELGKQAAAARKRKSVKRDYFKEQEDKARAIRESRPDLYK